MKIKDHLRRAVLLFLLPILLCSGISVGEWNRLKVVYYKGDAAAVRMGIYLNGALVYVSDNYFGYSTLAPDTHPAPNNSINRVYFYSFLATEGTLFADNMSLVGTSEVCTDTVGKK